MEPPNSLVLVSDFDVDRPNFHVISLGFCLFGCCGRFPFRDRLFDAPRAAFLATSFWLKPPKCDSPCKSCVPKLTTASMHTEHGYAYYPLTLYDAMFKDAAVVMGWLVEGALDIKILDSALNRLVSKWPMLAGRLELNEACSIVQTRPIIYR